MTTVIESRYSTQSIDDRFCLSAREVAELFASNRGMGFFRQDLGAGHIYFSEQACRIYQLEPTTAPVNLMDVLSRIHHEDIELLLLTLEERAMQRKSAHYIFRVADGKHGYQYIRIISAFRENGTEAGEVAGIIYPFFDRVPVAEIEGQPSDMRVSGTAKSIGEQDLRHIGLSEREIYGLIHAYQRIGYFRQIIDTGLAYFSPDACNIFELPQSRNAVSMTEIVRRLHPDDVGLLTSTFETAARLKTGFDLIYRIRQNGGDDRFIRMVAKCRQSSTGETELAGLVYEFFENMRIVDFDD